MPNKKDLKVKDDKVLWWNGKKWLVKEFCKNNKEAVKRKDEIELCQTTV